MNTVERKGQGLAVLCDYDGQIVTCLRDDLGLVERSKSTFLLNVLEGESLEKHAQLIEVLRKRRVAFNWSLTVRHVHGTRILKVAGKAVEKGLLIVAAPTMADVSRVYDEVFAEADQSNDFLSIVLADLSTQEAAQRERDHQLYEELSCANNELVTLQRELARKNHELMRLDALKTKFLGIASHDLRKPLSVIVMYTDFLLDHRDPPLSSEQLEMVRTIRQTSQSMVEEINDLLDLAQIESGKLSLNPSHFDFCAHARCRVDIHRQLARSKDISIHFEKPEQALIVNADEQRLKQVWDNLLDNAIKYSPRSSEIRVSVTKESGRVLATIKDSGTGISPEMQKQLFNPFTTAGSKPTGAEKSTGLGLSIVKAILQQHRGDIQLDRGADRGTIARFFLPTDE